ncbi:DUF1015 family protein [Microlunatus soli]|uniref:Uncharacterized conserved protein, DUF1015 family n=1 Tax=Microlunatus soli TaxID=630515 RepID=A0A1H2A2S6_9ACTN|nr:DUF1015 domain-containing protein [Microlunatus soli]SDT40244.1 Uncharacterized conserved protein, DUF1015 family [Microlunatus soli]
MPRFTPFRAVRYPTDTNFDAVVAPPYDVLSAEQVRYHHDRDPHNITRIDVPTGDDRYARAGALYRQWLDEGVLVADEAPTLTVYRLRFTDPTGAERTISGVLGGLEVVDEGAGGVLPHERTTPKASTDRLDLTRATGANLSPVWGLSLAAGLTDLLAEPGEPVAAVTDDADGFRVEHLLERITDPDRIAAITELIGTDDVLIADGHHRYGVARSYRDEVRTATGRTDTAAEDTLVFVNELVADQLSVAAIHRLYRGIAADTLRSAIGDRFDLAALDADHPDARPDPATLARMEAEGFLTLITAEGAWTMTPKPGAFDDVRALDGVWLEETLADLTAEVSYQHGVEEVLSAVGSGDAVAGVLIRPVGVAEIERTAREGLLMPPKSTFFTPKLKTGFVIRDLS